jgi:hypothetical protein
VRQDIATEPVKIAEFWKGRDRKTTVRVSLSSYRGRTYFVDDEGKMRPTKKGCTIGLGLLTEFRASIDKAISTAAELGLIKDEGAD